MNSQLSLEKKINVVAILDHFLAPKECNSNTQGSQRVAKKWLPLLHYCRQPWDDFQGMKFFHRAHGIHSEL